MSWCFMKVEIVPIMLCYWEWRNILEKNYLNCEFSKAEHPRDIEKKTQCNDYLVYKAWQLTLAQLENASTEF